MIEKTKSKESTISNMEDLLNVMMEERRKLNEMKMTTIEKGHLADHGQEIMQIQLEDKKCNDTNENGIGNGKIEIRTDDGCKCVASNATRICFSTSNGNP